MIIQGIVDGTYFRVFYKHTREVNGKKEVGGRREGGQRKELVRFLE